MKSIEFFWFGESIIILSILGGKVSALTASTLDDVFPAKEGWLMFTFNKWTFYILLQKRGVKVYGTHCKKIYKTVASIKGMYLLY